MKVQEVVVLHPEIVKSVVASQCWCRQVYPSGERGWAKHHHVNKVGPIFYDVLVWRAALNSS